MRSIAGLAEKKCGATTMARILINRSDVRHYIIYVLFMQQSDSTTAEAAARHT